MLHPASAIPQRRVGRVRFRNKRKPCLTVVVADDEAASVVLFDIPGRREAAGFGHHRHLGQSAQLLQGREVEQLGLFGPRTILLWANLKYAFNIILK